MPFYEYQCKNCGHALEAMQKISDSPLKKCPHCGKSQLQRLMSAPVFRLKGGGWYETDFKGDQDNKKNLADRPEADAPKDAVKDTAKDSTKDADGKGKDGKGTEAVAAKDAPTLKDKGTEKPAEKAAAADSGKKSVPTKPSKRGAASSPVKSNAKRPVKKPAPTLKRRR
jgi:putative FmdB family regulatory protein